MPEALDRKNGSAVKRNPIAAISSECTSEMSAPGRKENAKLRFATLAKIELKTAMSLENLTDKTSFRNHPMLKNG